MLHRDFLRARRGSTSESHPTPPTHGRKARPNTARHSSTIACSTPLSSVAGSSLASITALTGSANTSSMSATPHTARCRGEGGAFQDELSIAPRPPVNQPSEAFARHMSSSSLASGTHPPVSSPAEKVSVAVRCRPPNPEQGERQEDVIVSMDPRSREVYLLDEGSHKWRVDTPIWSCRGPARDGSATSTQAQIYEQVGRPLLLHALDGYNSTLMAYGQTGSGKTYTMMGGLKLSGEFREESAEYGLVPRICYDLFEEIDRRSFTAPSGETLSWEVHVRFVEIYCERISDLLNGGASISIREEITSDAASFVLLGATRIRAHNTVDLLRALNTGNKCRKTASTKSNERSSRSHAIFIMELTEILSFVEPDGSVVSAPSKSLAFRLVDLAGSERVSETGVMGQQLKEARDINLSLFTLGMVIESLTDKRRCIKPPYRDSALTKLLRDAFGGNSKTTMICTIGPCEAHRQQTIQTLNYAAKARRVLNKPHVDEDPSAAELRRANAELLNLRRELVDAQKSGTHHAQIEAQLKEAHDRLRRDQAEARERKLALEKRESALAARLREVEAQRQLYESQMSALEQEAERAKAEQTKREQDLNRAYRQAEKSNQLRLVELQRQQDASEHALKAKEEELIQHQREVEGKLQKMELQSRHRVDELLRQQREVEAEFRRREEEAKQKEREIASRQRKAEEDARQREEHIRGMEEEWTKHVQCIEEEFRSREDSIAKRMKEAQERLKLAEDEARVREGEMKERWSEAEQQARRLQTEMERKQAELDRRVLELNRQAQQRELELNHKLHDAEYQLHRREKESQHHQEEVELLKEEAARQSASVLFKEKSWQEQQSILTDSLRLREEQIRRREAELSAQFDELMNTRGNWERDYAAKVAVLQVSHDETAVALKQKESVLQQRDQELHQLRADFESQSAAKEMDFKRKELALLAQMNEGEARAQRERHINLRSKEDVQRAMDKVVSENHQREEKLRRWEEELTERRTKLEQQLLDREAHVLRREQALSGTREGLSEKLAEVDLLIQQHTAEQAVLREKMAEEESERKRQHTEQMEALQRRIADVDVGRPSRESICGAPSRCCLEHEQLALALQQMSRREVANLVAIETLYRLSIRGDEDVQSQFIAKSQRLESREINRQEAFVELSRQHQRAHASLERVQHECLRLSTQMEESTSQLRIQQADNERLQEELMNLRIQRSSALSTAACADETSQRIRQDAMDALEAHRQELQSMSEQLRSARDESDQSTEKYLRLSCAALLMLTQLEEQQRYLLEHHAGHERLAMKKLEISDMESNAKNRSIEQWKCLYREKDSNHLEAAHLAVLDAQRLDLRTRQEEELKLRETAVAERENIVERREHQLQRQAQDRPSTRAVDQLHESEIRVAAKEVELHEREENLVQLAIRLKEKESVLTSRLYEAQQNLIRHTALQLVELYHSQERVERESIRRLADLHYERCVCGTLDATSTHQQLRIRRDAAVAAESVALEEKMAQSEAENARRRKQLADEELQLQAYLRALQMEDIRRAELSEKGQAVVEEAEARLAQARQREEAMEALARRVQLQALSAEEEVKEKECSLQKRSIDLQRRMKERYAELERKQQVVRSQTEGFQRELQDLEMELCSIIYKNKNAELELRSKDGELQRQKMYYADLTKTLEERERLLKLERAHRADGFRSATSLAGDLLDVNDLLKKQLLIWRRKFDVLHAQDKLECEHCAWLNRKDALKCRCCGNALLPASDSH